MFVQSRNLKYEIDRYSPTKLKVGINFRSYASKGRKSINNAEINNVLTYYSEADIKEYTESILEYRTGNGRYRIIKQANQYTKLTDIKIEYSQEYPLAAYITKIETESIRSWDFSRKAKERNVVQYSFELGFSNLILRVYDNNKYKLNLEMKTKALKQQQWVQFDKETLEVAKIVYNTAYLYSINHYFEVISKINALVNTKMPVLDSKVITPYIPFSAQQLRSGVIINNPKTIYTVSHLVEGDRVYFMIALNSIWLLNAKTKSLSRILPYITGVMAQLFQKLDGMILDGVLVAIKNIKPEDRSNYQGYDAIYYIYDVINAGAGKKLSMINKKFINTTTNIQRYNIQLLELIKRNFIAMYSKLSNQLNYTLYLSTLDQTGIIENKILNRAGNPIGGFNYIMAKVFESAKESVYPIKGLLFKPNEDTYFNHNTLIWQAEYELNLKIKRSGRDLLLYTQDNKLFMGTKKIPYNNRMLDLKSSLFDKIKDEIFYFISFSWNREILKLTPLQIHLTEIELDTAKSAQSKWKAIHDNITTETLQANDQAEFTYYQRDIRFNLIKTAIQQMANKSQKPNVIDLNPIKTSLVQYYQGCNRVLAFVDIEDDLYDLKMSINEIYGIKVKLVKDLIVLNKVRSNIVLIDRNLLPQLEIIVERYLNQRVDIVVSFYYLNSWWRDYELLKQNVELISKILKGCWIWLIFDADKLKPNLEGQMNDQLAIEGKPIYQVKANQIHFDLELFPEFPYQNDNLYLTHSDDLILELQKHNFEKREHWGCDGRKLLNQRAYLLSNLFSYALFSNTKEYKIRKPKSEFAYVMLLMLGDKYIPGIIAAAYSLKQTNTPYDIVLMHTNEVSKNGIDLLHKSRVIDKFVLIEKLNYPMKNAEIHQGTYYEEIMSAVYSKWNALTLVQYDKVLFIDADMIILRNIDALFELKTPAAYFGRRGASQREIDLFGLEGIVKDYSIIKYPIKTGESVTNEMVWRGLNEIHTINAGLVLLRPDQSKYEEMIDILANTEGGFGFINCKSGIDEQIISYLYIKNTAMDSKDSIWTAVGSEYNFGPAKPGRLLVNPKKSINTYKTPNIIHFIRSNPWDSAPKSDKMHYLTDKMWMYYFWSAIKNSKLPFSAFKDLINIKRYHYISRSKSIDRFKYNLGWFDQKYFPWAFNSDVEPQQLKAKVGKYAYVWLVDNKTQMVIDALVSALSVVSTGAGSDLILLANDLPTNQLEFIQKSHIFMNVIVTNETDPVLAKLEILKLKEYTKIIYLDASTIAYELLSFLFDLRAPAGLFNSFSYKHAQKIGNAIVRKQLDLNYGVNDALMVLKPSIENYNKALKVYQSGNYGKGLSNDFEKVLTYTFSAGATLKKHWTFIAAEYSKVTEEPIKIVGTRALRAKNFKWRFTKKWFKQSWPEQQNNLWIKGLRDIIKYIEDYDMTANELEVFSIQKEEINDLKFQLEIEQVEASQFQALKKIEKEKLTKIPAEMEKWKREQIKALEKQRSKEIKGIEAKR